MFRVVFLTLLAAPIVLFASRSMAQPALPAGISEDELFGTMLRSSKWPKMPIQLCWVNPAPDNEHGRLVTRKAVEDTWVANSLVRFDGWNITCQPSAPGLHIKVSDTGDAPGTLGIGKYLSARPDGLTLNFTYKNWGQNCQANIDFCITAIAAHEFGHVLGFTHEQNRDDAPPQCRKDQQGINGDYKVTQYDADSIMNYCNPKWNGNGQLSALDIQAVQKVYGQ